MGEYHIKGGQRLSGQLSIYGAKNAVLPMLAAVVLNKGISVIHNCPRISDTFMVIKILKAIGADVKMEGTTITIDSTGADNYEVPEKYVREMRSSIIFLGSVLGRFGQVKISYPGGCELGARPIDLHLKGIRQLGANIVEEGGFIVAEAAKLKGARIDLDFPSVGATENIMLAAVLAEGRTIISNAAKEPEIVDMQNFLCAMGAKVSGAGKDTIVIDGVKNLHDVEYTVMPDRIVAGTYLTAAAITGGELLLTNVSPSHLHPITSKLAETGCEIKTEKTRVYLKAPKELKPIERLRTHPHPGFPTDMQPQLMALLSTAKGMSIVEETVFESRNKHISELIRMGANIVLLQDGMTSVVTGVKKLQGANVICRDLRGGAALILAGLAAEGKTVVTNSVFVERGYVDIEEDLRIIGADICYVK
ncbi:MAG: UDP-N-acetylglucosamine 1-carboxyvinyltransferase [Defluviitaleaceae bacterium]|nr:UDP-N-acetylglucosamine 1-carboxyvinyltransferase [Defluviitaleaceae bacterium]